MPARIVRSGFTIGRLARLAGIGVETVRYYEREGLLDRPRRPFGGVRTYEREALERLAFVHEAKALGFTLKEIRDLIRLGSDPGADAAAVRARVVAKLGETERSLVVLERRRSTLRGLLSQCPGGGAVGECPIVQALTATGPAVPAGPAIDPLTPE